MPTRIVSSILHLALTRECPFKVLDDCQNRGDVFSFHIVSPRLWSLMKQFPGCLVNFWWSWSVRLIPLVLNSVVESHSQRQQQNRPVKPSRNWHHCAGNLMRQVVAVSVRCFCRSHSYILASEWATGLSASSNNFSRRSQDLHPYFVYGAWCFHVVRLLRTEINYLKPLLNRCVLSKVQRPLKLKFHQAPFFLKISTFSDRSQVMNNAESNCRGNCPIGWTRRLGRKRFQWRFHGPPLTSAHKCFFWPSAFSIQVLMHP